MNSGKNKKLWPQFLIINLIAFAYALVGVYLAQGWINDLTLWTHNRTWSTMIVFFIAIIPGYLNIMLLASLYFYKYQPVRFKEKDYPPVSVLIAAYNEEDNMRETFRGLSHQLYPNELEVVVVNDGSLDHTMEYLRSLSFKNLRVIDARHGGKANALNIGLKECKNELVVTIDADTFLHRKAIRRITARLLSRDDYAAVAGDVLVRNERYSRLLRIQAWDYMLGIAAVKRQQSMFDGTLVAQGAFSAFRKTSLLALKGWQDRIGEDIVLTWALLKAGWHVGYEPTAIAFTNAPLGFKRFLSQRRRWARGMIEGFKEHIDIIWKLHDYRSFFVAIDLFFPIIDGFYTFVFIPGIVMACFGYFYIVGLYTLLVIPINLCIIAMMMYTQMRFLRYVGVRIRENPVGMVFYILLYQIFISPICVQGYLQELLGDKKRW